MFMHWSHKAFGKAQIFRSSFQPVTRFNFATSLNTPFKKVDLMMLEAFLDYEWLVYGLYVYVHVDNPLNSVMYPDTVCQSENYSVLSCRR